MRRAPPEQTRVRSGPNGEKPGVERVAAKGIAKRVDVRSDPLPIDSRHGRHPADKGRSDLVHLVRRQVELRGQRR